MATRVSNVITELVESAPASNRVSNVVVEVATLSVAVQRVSNVVPEVGSVGVKSTRVSNVIVEILAANAILNRVSNVIVEMASAGLMFFWSQVSGPCTAIFEDTSILNPQVCFPCAGVYTLRLTVDNGDAEYFDDVVITVIDECTAPIDPPFDDEGN